MQLKIENFLGCIYSTAKLVKIANISYTLSTIDRKTKTSDKVILFILLCSITVHTFRKETLLLIHTHIISFEMCLLLFMTGQVLRLKRSQKIWSWCVDVEAMIAKPFKYHVPSETMPTETIAETACPLIGTLLQTNWSRI